jgi:predicted transcriptional regulator
MYVLPDLKKIVLEIRVKREKYQIKSYKLAKYAGISASTLSKVEKGKINPSYELIYKIVSSLDELIYSSGKNTKIKDVMTSPVIKLSPIDSTSKAKAIIKEKGISQIPIIDERGIVVGLITEKGLLNNPNAKICAECISYSYSILGPDYDFETAKNIIKGNQAILVEKNGSLIGILTKSDFI